MPVDLAELSLHLAEYFARVCAGETIFVEEQGRVLVKLAPVSDRGDVDQQEMEELVRQGIARAPVQPLTAEDVSALLSPILQAEPGPDVVAALLAERESGR